jgi:exopolysaccharide biosynthesis polyprenyl glycosylphosphotransferase
MKPAPSNEAALASDHPGTVTSLKAPLSGFEAVDVESLVGSDTRIPREPVEESLEMGSQAEEILVRRIRPNHRRFALLALLLADTAALSAALLLSGLFDHLGNGASTIAGAFASMLYLPVGLVVMAAYGLYRRGRRRLVASSFPDLGQLVHAMIVSCLLLLLVEGVAHRLFYLPQLERRTILAFGVLAIVLVLTARMVARRIAQMTYHASRVLIVGSGLVASSVAFRVGHVPGLRIVGFVDDNILESDRKGDMPLLGSLDDIVDVIERFDVDHVVVAFSPVVESRMAGLLRSLADDVQISVVPRMFDLLTVRSHVDDLAGLPVVDVAPASLGPADRFAKRALDVTTSGLGLLLLSPLFLTICVAIKATSPGPVIFRQERKGRRGESFPILKFRSMRMSAESERHDLDQTNEVDGPIFKLREDPRITRIGQLLRRTSLDELPQLVNVLIGDMSLVGPRPFVLSEAAEIGGWAARRFDVRPGMTGLWQISGRSDLPFEELRRLDYSYVASWSLWWDLRILWHTPAAVFNRDGAY